MKKTLEVLSLLLVIAGPLANCAPGEDSWSQDGNAGTDSTVNFLGTIDQESLAIRTDNQERVRVTDRGRVGIGTADPEARLDVRPGVGEDGLVVRHDAGGEPELLVDENGNTRMNSSGGFARLVVRNDFFNQRPLMSVVAGDHPTLHVSSAGSVTIDPVGAGVALRVRSSSSTPNSNTTPVPFYVTGADDVNAIYVTREGEVGIGVAGEGINDRLRIRGGENDGTRASVRIVSGGNQQTMLLDGNEIDGINAGLFLNHNTDENVILATGGGGVGIGTQTPGNFRLAVNGPIRATEVVVETGWSDFVFEPGYELRSLEEVRAHVEEHRHLPDVPTAEEVAEHGVKLGEMESKLLRKVEELTLYLIELNDRVGALEGENARLRGAGGAR